MATPNTFAARDATQKNGRHPEGAGRSDLTMLKIAERPTEGKAEANPFIGFSDDHRAAMWLDEEVKKARKGVTTQVVELTPALARVLLERNPDNRRLNANVLDTYVRDMQNGAWRFNGEPLIVSADGKLNDGQHRCTAVVEADVSMPAVLIIGVARDSRETLDQGRTRTASDYLSMNGHINTNNLAATASFIWQYRTRGLLSGNTRDRPTKSEVLNLVSDHPGILDSVHVVQSVHAAAFGGKSLLAFCHWTFWQASARSDADDFIQALLRGDGLLSRDPVLYVRNRLIAERGRSRANDKAELIFRAWNARRKGETPRTMMIVGGVLPVVES